MTVVQVLGTGCKKCAQLQANAEIAAKQAGVDANVEKVTDIVQITSFGVMATPALVIDGVVKFMGKVVSPEEIAKLLKS